MGVMSIRIDDQKRKILKIMASIEGKTMGGIVTELIEEYIQKNKSRLITISEKEHLYDIMKLAESSLQEWDNEEDAIYDDL